MSGGRVDRRAPLLLVLRALGLGDFLTAVPAYRALARAFPKHRRMLAAPAGLHPLAGLLDGAFHETLDVRPLGALPGDATGAAVGVNLHGSGPQSHRLMLAAAPQRFIAFAHPEVAASSGGARFDAGEHEVTRWCRLLEHAGIAADERELGLPAPDVAVPSGRSGATLVHAGAASAARRWPPERWVEVVRHCAARGERILLTGSGSERALALAIADGAGLPPSCVVAGETSLLELAALVARAQRVMSGDTGIAHLASAYGVASIVLFGPMPPTIWGPPARAQHRVLWAGRSGDPQAATPDRGLLEITPARVIAVLDDLVARGRIEAASGGETTVSN